MGYRTPIIKCAICGKEVDQIRQDQRTCGAANCRQAWKRDKDRLPQTIQDVYRLIDTIGGYRHEPGVLGIKASRALQELRDYIEGKLNT